MLLFKCRIKVLFVYKSGMRFSRQSLLMCCILFLYLLIVLHNCKKKQQKIHTPVILWLDTYLLRINYYHLTSIRKDNSSAKDNQVHIAFSGIFLIVDAIISYKNILSTYVFVWAHFLMIFPYISLKQARGWFSCIELGQVISITFSRKTN